MKKRIISLFLAMVIIALVMPLNNLSIVSADASIELITMPMVAAGNYHTLGLKIDGTVIAVGNTFEGQCDVSSWNNIIAIAAGSEYSVGLKRDGTVVATGENADNQCNVSMWRNITAISAGYYHTVGLKSDETVVAVGKDDYGQCNVSSWNNIITIASDEYHTVGLKNNGTVVATGRNDYGQCEVSSWNNIIAIAAGKYHTVGLKSDGTVVAVGRNDYEQCNVLVWNNITDIVASGYYTIGVKKDGSVIYTSYASEINANLSLWHSINNISTKNYHVAGLKNNGTVIASKAGIWYDYGQDNVSKWDLSQYGLFKEKTTINSFLKNEFINKNGFSVIIRDNHDNIVSDNNKCLGTGYTVEYYKDNILKLISTIVIKGDANGDGKVEAIDYLYCKKAVLNLITLNSAQEAALSINNGKNPTATDYLLIKKHVLGSYIIFK